MGGSRQWKWSVQESVLWLSSRQITQEAVLRSSQPKLEPEEGGKGRTASQPPEQRCFCGCLNGEAHSWPLVCLAGVSNTAVSLSP